MSAKEILRSRKDHALPKRSKARTAFLVRAHCVDGTCQRAVSSEPPSRNIWDDQRLRGGAA